MWRGTDGGWGLALILDAAWLSDIPCRDRVIEAHGENIFTLFLDHAAQSRPPFMTRPCLFDICLGNEHHDIGGSVARMLHERPPYRSGPKGTPFQSRRRTPRRTASHWARSEDSPPSQSKSFKAISRSVICISVATGSTSFGDWSTPWSNPT